LELRLTLAAQVRAAGDNAANTVFVPSELEAWLPIPLGDRGTFGAPEGASNVDFHGRIQHALLRSLAAAPIALLSGANTSAHDAPIEAFG
jgi:hypothetical protein